MPEIAKPRAQVETFGDFIDKQDAPWVKVENEAGVATLANLKAQTAWGWTLSGQLSDRPKGYSGAS